MPFDIDWVGSGGSIFGMFGNVLNSIQQVIGYQGARFWSNTLGMKTGPLEPTGLEAPLMPIPPPPNAATPITETPIPGEVVTTDTGTVNNYYNYYYGQEEQNGGQQGGFLGLGNIGDLLSGILPLLILIPLMKSFMSGSDEEETPTRKKRQTTYDDDYEEY